MSVLLAEHTREQIKAMAPESVVVLPTASVEQHGIALPILTDTLLCGHVAEAAAIEASKSISIFVAPVFAYGHSHHHRPFAGVLSLSSEAYMHALTDVLEGLFLSRFRKIIVLNGHGGNSAINAVVCADFIQHPDHDVTIAYANYWDIAKDTIVESDIMPRELVPGHAGRFEASMIMAIRPDLVDYEALAKSAEMVETGDAVSGMIAGGTIQKHGAWAASRGFTDTPSLATSEDGKSMMEITVREVAAFFTAFANCQ